MIVSACVGPINLPSRLNWGDQVTSFCEDCIVYHHSENRGMIFIDSFKPEELKDMPMWYGDTFNRDLCLENSVLIRTLENQMYHMLSVLEDSLVRLLEVEAEVKNIVNRHNMVKDFIKLLKKLDKNQVEEVINALQV